MKRRLIKIVIAFSVSFLIMGALSLISIERLNTYISYSDLMDQSGFVTERIFSVEKGIRDIDRAERGYMITKDTMYLRFLNNAVDSVFQGTRNLKDITKNDDALQGKVTLLNASFAKRVAALRANIHFVDTTTGGAVSKYYFESRQQMLDCSQLLKNIHDSENALRENHYRNETMYAELTTKTMKALLMVFCIITLFLFALLVKELNGRMRYQDELQAKIIDLRRSHVELQEIAYVASHDLQEPLRKIQVFSNMLLYLKPDITNEQLREILQRINSSAGRMQSLMKDLNSLTSLTTTDELKHEVDLNRTLRFILTEMEEGIQKKGAVINMMVLPHVRGYEHQLKILFAALLDNALKFSRVEVVPEINIGTMVTDGGELHDLNPKLKKQKFQCIFIEDNGIGFAQEFSTKVFQLFQRLHQKESGYEGKGLGLAICQRVMVNHEGFILTESKAGLGSTFKLFFPIEEK